MQGGREVSRAVDLETTPLFVRAGAILPLGPVKQYAEEKVDEPISLHIYPGADASFLLYEDDGVSFNYRRGEWMGIQLTWDSYDRVLHLQLAPGSKMLAAKNTHFEVKLQNTSRSITFDGSPLEAKL